jgi:hypothetical protein
MLTAETLRDDVKILISLSSKSTCALHEDSFLVVYADSLQFTLQFVNFL